MKEIRIGIIGTGVIAHDHLRNYQEIQGVKVVAACDLIPKKLNDFCQKHDIKEQSVNFRDLIKRDDIDAIDVCVHNNLHTSIGIEVLKSGKHCYMEKPLSGSYKDALHLYETAKECGKMLHMQVASLYTPQARGAKTIIKDGKLGSIYHGRSYGYRRRGRPYVDGYAEKEFNSKYWAAGGALYDMGVYHISLMLYLMGLPKIEKVSGKVYQKLDMDETRRRAGGFDVEELGVGLVKFSDGATLDILESWAVHGGQFPPSMLMGSKGGLLIESFGNESTALKYYEELSGYPIEASIDLSSEEYRKHQLHPEEAYFDSSQQHWIAALRGDCKLLNTAEIGLNTMLISNGIYLSSEFGREFSSDEIIEQSVSTAIKEQETSFGTIKYNL